MKSSLSEIKLLLQHRVVTEASQNLAEDGNDSVDVQIDKYLMEYEADASENDEKNESVDLFSITKNFLLEKDEKDDKDDEKTDDSLATKTADDIDVKSFGTSVARLVDNASSLLELRNVILRRAVNYLVKNYDDETVRRFQVFMEDEFDLVPGQSSRDQYSDEKKPTAGEAGPYGSTAGSVP